MKYQDLCCFRFDEIVDAVKTQQNEMGALNMKVTATIDTMAKQSGEITDIQKDLGTLEERVEVVEDDLGDTKVKVEEIDNKVVFLAHLYYVQCDLFSRRFRHVCMRLSGHNICSLAGSYVNISFF